MKIPRSRLLLAALGVLPATCALAQPVMFDFDTGTPPLSVGQVIPFEQTSGGVTARFSSAGGPAFSIQTNASTGWRMSMFSGKYLYDNNLDRSVLTIEFSRTLTAITLTFATADFEIEVPSNLQLTAYLDSRQSPPVGSATAHGSYIGDTMPMGALSYDSGGRPFNLVEITVPFQTGGATTFFLDNIAAKPAEAAPVLTSTCAASYMGNAPLAAGSIASGFGRNLASATEAASAIPLPTTLANTTLSIRDSAGVERLAPLFFVSPGQINYLVPDATAPGRATVTVTSGTLAPVTGTLDVVPVAPGIFTANQDGKGVPAAEAIAVAPDQTQTRLPVAQCGAAPGSCVAAPIDLGPEGSTLILALYGTGIRGRSSLAAVTARIGPYDAPVQYAGAQPSFVGLDQVNLLVPRALAGLGAVDVVLSVDGRAANTVQVNIR